MVARVDGLPRVVRRELGGVDALHQTVGLDEAGDQHDRPSSRVDDEPGRVGAGHVDRLQLGAGRAHRVERRVETAVEPQVADVEGRAARLDRGERAAWLVGGAGLLSASRCAGAPAHRRGASGRRTGSRRRPRRRRTAAGPRRRDESSLHPEPSEEQPASTGSRGSAAPGRACASGRGPVGDRGRERRAATASAGRRRREPPRPRRCRSGARRPGARSRGRGPEPGIAAGLLRAVEAVEDVRPVLLGDARALVVDGQDAVDEAHRDGAAGRAPLGGVVEQVGDGALEAGGSRRSTYQGCGRRRRR